MLCHYRALHGNAGINYTTDSRGRADSDASLLQEAVWSARCLFQSASLQSSWMRAMSWPFYTPLRSCIFFMATAWSTSVADAAAAVGLVSIFSMVILARVSTTDSDSSEICSALTVVCESHAD